MLTLGVPITVAMISLPSTSFMNEEAEFVPIGYSSRVLRATSQGTLQREIQELDLGIVNNRVVSPFPHAQPQPEIWGCRHVRSLARHDLQPQKRPAHEVQRGHEACPPAGYEWSKSHLD